MVSIALLMIEQSHNKIATEQIKVAGEPLLYHQIVQLRNFGISRFIIAVEKIDSMTLQIATNLRSEGVEVEFISRLDALGDILASDDSFLMISDGVLSSDKHIENMMNALSSEILVFENDDKLSRFELIDLNYRWSGLARLTGDILSSIENLPEDSAIQSTLLRIALQQDCMLKVIESVPSSLIRITERSAAKSLSEAKIKSSLKAINLRGFCETILFYPLIRFLLLYLWRGGQFSLLNKYTINYGYLLFFAIAIIFAILGFSIASYILAIIAYFCCCFRKIQNNLKPNADIKSVQIISDVSIFLILIVTVHTKDNLWSVSGAIIIFLLGYSAQRLSFEINYNRFIFSFCDILCLMVLALIFDIQSYAIIIISILYALWIFGGTILLNSQISDNLKK